MEAALIAGTVFSAISFVIWTLANTWLRRTHLKAATEFNLRVLDRIGSIKDFSEFLQTEGGAKFMASLTTNVTVRPAGSPSGRILLASQVGIVLSALGIGLLSLQAGLVANSSDAVGFIIIGVIALSIGIGFVVSAGVSFWLARTLNVLDVAHDERRIRDAA